MMMSVSEINMTPLVDVMLVLLIILLLPSCINALGKY
ncbi:MAG: biopolymer transporter ExbD [Moraxellaceae bacterium]|nr:biopolymer transporter ExbD [Moraxellaceae bacterium]